MPISQRIRVFASATLALILCVATAHADEDPPGRVARLSYLDGSVTFAPAGSEDWAYATINRPLTTGDQLWVDQGGRAELYAGQTALRVGSQTSLDVLTLDDNTFQLKVAQGMVSLHVRKLWEGQSVEVDTPNLALVIHQAGEYRLDVNPNDNTTMVSVRRGLGEVYGGNDASVTVPPGQWMRFGGNELADVAAATLGAYDGFDQWVAERDQRDENSVSAQYVSREVVGYEDLDTNGSWQTVEGYGTVWYPTVTVVDWAPYRYGHWAWVAPWGWTWIDDARWGFAPFHYGRWAMINGAWAWIPGPFQPRPYYAPALVAFVGGGHGVHWGVSLGGGGMGVAWFPLGPGEAYRPAYSVSPAYSNNVNRTVNYANINSTVIKNTTVINNVYINQSAGVTAVPANAFVGGQSVHKVVARLDPAVLRSAQIGGAPAVAPVQQSLIGGAKPAIAAPPNRIVARQVVATRAPAEPAALRDNLARQYIAQGNTVSGAGPLPKTLSNPQPVFVPANKTVSVLAVPAAAHVTNVTNIGSPRTSNMPNNANAPAIGFGQTPPTPHVNPSQGNGVPRPPAFPANQQSQFEQSHMPNEVNGNQRPIAPVVSAPRAALQSTESANFITQQRQRTEQEETLRVEQTPERQQVERPQAESLPHVVQQPSFAPRQSPQQIAPAPREQKPSTDKKDAHDGRDKHGE